MSNDELRAAVATSRSWRGLSRALGGDQGPRALRARCDRLGISYGHFRTRSWSDADLLSAVPAANGWPDLLATLGYEPGSGSSRATVRKHAARLGISTTHLDLRPREEGRPFSALPDLRHLRAAGAFLVAGACAMRGMRVAWPLEPAPYDLLVDTGTALQRVQVKTTTWRLNGAWACKITRRSAGRTAWYTKADIDLFAVVDGDMRVYVIPVEVVDGLGTILVRHYDAYLLR